MREAHKRFHTFFKYIIRTAFQEEEAAKRKEARAAHRLEKAKRCKEIEDGEDDKHDGDEAVPPPKKKCVRDTHGDSEHEVEVVHEPKTPETDHGELNPIWSARRDRTVRHDSDDTVSDLSTESPSVASLGGGTSSDGSTPKKKKKKSKPTKKGTPKKTLSYSESWS